MWREYESKYFSYSTTNRAILYLSFKITFCRDKDLFYNFFRVAPSVSHESWPMIWLRTDNELENNFIAFSSNFKKKKTSESHLDSQLNRESNGLWLEKQAPIFDGVDCSGNSGFWYTARKIHKFYYYQQNFGRTLNVNKWMIQQNGGENNRTMKAMFARWHNG